MKWLKKIRWTFTVTNFGFKTMVLVLKMIDSDSYKERISFFRILLTSYENLIFQSRHMVWLSFSKKNTKGKSFKPRNTIVPIYSWKLYELWLVFPISNYRQCFVLQVLMFGVISQAHLNTNWFHMPKLWFRFLKCLTRPKYSERTIFLIQHGFRIKKIF